MPTRGVAGVLLFACSALAPVSAQAPADDLDLRARMVALPGEVVVTEGRVEIDSPALLRERDHHVWGGTAVRGEDGRYHMFVSRFRADAEARPFRDEWLLSSEIAHAVAEQPARGFAFDGVVLRGRRHDDAPDAWDAQSVHNPHVRRFGDRVCLYYIGTRDPGPPPEGSPGASLRDRDRLQQSQCIGLVDAGSVAELVAGRFTRRDRPLLAPRTRVKARDVLSPSPPGTKPLPDNLIVVNPSVVQRPGDGRYLLFFKGNLYDPDWRGVHGVAIGEAVDGPFAARDEFVFALRQDDGRLANAEDPFVWRDAERQRYYAIVKDFSGRLTGAGKGLALLTSADGLDWRPARHPLVSPLELRFADGTVLPVKRLERPQLLLDGRGQPLALYCACIFGDGYEGHACNVQIALREQ